MAITWKQNSASRIPNIIAHIKPKASTTFTTGVSVKLALGVWDVCAAADAVVGVYNGPTFTSVASPTDPIEVIEATPNDVFEIDYINTPNAAFVPGLNVAPVASGGLNLDSAVVTGGAWALTYVNTTTKKVLARCKLRQLS